MGKDKIPPPPKVLQLQHVMPVGDSALRRGYVTVHNIKSRQGMEVGLRLLAPNRLT